MPICNTDNFINQLQTEINSIVGDDIAWKEISAGTQHFAAIKTDGTLWTWGGNTAGRLGNGTLTDRCSPGTVVGGGSWFKVSPGFQANAAIKCDGTLWTWGFNTNFELGDGTTVARCSPGTVAGGGTTWCNVSSGDFRVAAIKCDGTLWTWGISNSCGTLGEGTTVGRCSPGTIAGGGTTWCQVSATSCHMVAIKCDGTLWTWGNNSCGQLGDGTTVARCSPGTTWGSYTTWCQVSIGVNATASVKTDGTLWTWGQNVQGQLGNNSTVTRCSPGTVAGGGTTWRQVCTTSFFTSAIKTDGTLWTWGNNGDGRLGDGTTVSRSSPGTVAGGGTNWCQISSVSQSLSTKCDGTLWTWGYNLCGGLGDGTKVNRCSPGSVAIQPVSSAEDLLMYAEAVAQITDNRQVSVASSSNLPDIYSFCIPNGQMVFVEDRNLPVIACGHDWNGLDGRTLVSGPKFSVFTWGFNTSGQLGDGTTVTRCSPGTIFGGGTTWCYVFGSKAAIQGAIKTDGTLWTWGSATCGLLGNGTAVGRCSPGTVAGGNATWCQASGGVCAFAAIKTDGTLWTWGRNSYSILGDGSNCSNARCSPGTISGGGTTWCQVSMLCSHALALKTDGTLWAWGKGSNGGVGDGFANCRCSPVTVAGGGINWCQISANLSSFAIKTDGTLWTWGCNSVGQLGDGTIVSRCSPGTVAGGGTTWCQVASGLGHVLAIKTDGTLWTWGGNNTQGKLGDGTTVTRCSPGTVAGGGTTWCYGFGGESMSAAIKTDGTLWTWGCNSFGELGDGTTVSRCSPGTIAGGGTTWRQIAGNQPGQPSIIALTTQ